MHNTLSTSGGGGPIAGSGNGVQPNPSLSIDNPLRNMNENQHDHNDMARIKDGITLSPQEEEELIGDQIRLDIKCPSLNDSTGSKMISVPISTTIAELKNNIQSSWPGSPKASGMRFFKSGQTLSDEMIIGQIVKESERAEPAPVHLVIRPDAWTELRKSQNVSQSSTKRNIDGLNSQNSTEKDSSAKKYVNPRSLPPLIPDIGPDMSWALPSDTHLTNMLTKMSLDQLLILSSLLSWIYARYYHKYETEWEKLYGDPTKKPNGDNEMSQDLKELVKVMGCSMDEVDSVIDQIEQNFFLWGPLEDSIAQYDTQNPYRYKKFNFQGLPYLLRVEQSAESERLRALHGRIEHIRFTHHQLERVINYQTLIDQALPMTQAMERQGIHPFTPFLDGAQGPGFPGVAVRRSTFLDRFNGIQREDLFSVFFSTLFLSLKVGLLVYVLTRGASTRKQTYMTGIAVLYVLYEGWRTLMKKAHARRRANRRAGGGNGAANGVGRNEDGAERQNALRPQQQRQQQQQQQQQQDQPIAGQQNENEIPSPPAPARYTTFSPFLLEFWIERIAYFRLHEEDREIGLQLSTGQRRVQPQAVDGQHNPIMKMIDSFNDYFLLPLILFISTLIPEIEQRRRRAIDQREELIRSTARKVEEQERKLREKQEKSTEEGDSNAAIKTTTLSNSVQIRQPDLLSTPYAQRILDQRRSEGRQIDIAQELEAAAAAAAREEGEGAFEQADMGFL